MEFPRSKEEWREHCRRAWRNEMRESIREAARLARLLGDPDIQDALLEILEMEKEPSCTG